MNVEIQIHLSYNEGHNGPTNFSQPTTPTLNRKNLRLIKILVLYDRAVNMIGLWNPNRDIS